MNRTSTISATILAMTATALLSAAQPADSGPTGNGADQIQDRNSDPDQPAQESNACLADINQEGQGDGVVDVHDLMYVLGNWGHCTADDILACGSDVNQDGRVNVMDLIAVIEAYGAVCPTGSGG